MDTLSASSAATIPLLVTTYTKDLKNPEAWNWNTTVERELPFSMVTTIAYVGRRGLHLQREADINQPTIAAVQAAPAGTNIDSLRPYKGYGPIRQSGDVASSRYNSLQATLNRRFTNGLLFGVSYTYSKSMDDGSNYRDIVPDTYDTSFLWGPSEFDTRHVLIVNYLYDLPIFKGQHGFLGKTLGGWQISGIAQMQTGQPCSVAVNTDYAGVGQDANFGCGTSGQYWVMNGKPKILHQFGPNGQYFSTTNPDGTPIFTQPTKGTFNTQHVRDIIPQPGIDNWNMGLFKSLPVGERVKLQFRAEAFNVWNHPNWCSANGCGGGSSVGLNPTSAATFGKVLVKGSTGAAGGERNLQLSLRMQF